MTYDPRRVSLAKLSGAAMLGWTFQLGISRLGMTADTRTEVRVSAVSMTDGYEVGQSGELTIDPMTGSATISDTIGPLPAGTVPDSLNTALIAGDRIQLTYGTTVVQQGIVSGVKGHMQSDGMYWERKTTFDFSGTAGIWLANTVSWSSLPQEPSLTRLGRWFSVDINRLSAGQIAYLNGINMPGANAGSSTYLDQARAFTAATLFPVRPASPIPARWPEIAVVPAVTFQGTLPPAAITNAHVWTCGADFTAAGGAQNNTAVEVVKDYDGFISGFTDAPGPPPAALGNFRLAASPLGTNTTVPVGLQTPVVIDAFGTRLVVSKIVHNFTSRDYRSGLEVVAPAAVG